MRGWGDPGRSGFFAGLEQAPEGLDQEAADFLNALQAEQKETGSTAAAGERIA